MMNTKSPGTNKSRPAFLRSAREISGAVSRVLRTSGGDRLALVAFVGAGARDFLPDCVEGLSLYCWPKAGCTDAGTVREMIDDGANVYFVDQLHCKVFWSEREGAVVGSANLTDNGLSGGLTEACVWMPPGTIRRSDLLAMVKKARPVTPAMLHKLELETRRYRAANQGHDVFRTTGRMNRQRPQGFRSWLKRHLEEEEHAEWRIAVHDSVYSAKEGREIEAREYLQPDDSRKHFYWSGTKGQTEEGRWLLSFDPRRLVNSAWFCATSRQKVRKRDHDLIEGDYLAVQKIETSKLGVPPFRPDQRFLKALKVFLKKRNALTWESACRAIPRDVLSRRHLQEIGNLY